MISNINDIHNLRIKKCFKYEVLGMEDAIDGKHRFTSVKCESREGEVIEIKIIDFIYYCFHRNISINYLKDIIFDLKDILIKKIEKAILVERNSIIKPLKAYDNKGETKTKNNLSKENELQIQKKAYKNNYIEEKIFDLWR